MTPIKYPDDFGRAKIERTCELIRLYQNTLPDIHMKIYNFEFKDGFRLPDRYISKHSQDQLEIKNKYLSELGELWNVDIKILHNDDV